MKDSISFSMFSCKNLIEQEWTDTCSVFVFSFFFLNLCITSRVFNYGIPPKRFRWQYLFSFHLDCVLYISNVLCLVFLLFVIAPWIEEIKLN